MDKTSNLTAQGGMVESDQRCKCCSSQLKLDHLPGSIDKNNCIILFCTHNRTKFSSKMKKLTKPSLIKTHFIVHWNNTDFRFIYIAA